MSSKFVSNIDRRLLKAQSATRSAARKLLRLGFTERKALKLMEDALTVNKETDYRKSKGLRSQRESRLKRAQHAIRLHIQLGLSETDIGNLVNVSPGTICRILSGRLPSEKLVAALEAELPKVRVLDTCNAACVNMDNQTREELEAMVPVALVRGLSSVRFPKGISAFLATFGDPRHPVYVMLIEQPVSELGAHLKLLEHEVEHILARIREQRQREESSENEESTKLADGIIA
jgi:hypothetical protein